MTCLECGGGRFEYTGLTGVGAARLTCTRCTRVVEQTIAAVPAPRADAAVALVR